MKKFLSILLAVLLVAAMIPLTASAATVSGTCGDNLAWTLEKGTLAISGTGPMDDYDNNYYETPWYEKLDSIQNVVINSGMTTIGDLAFASCGNLTSVTIPDSVTSIGDGAFAECLKLDNITIPDSVTTIGKWAFLSCTMTSITIPASVTSIGEYALGYKTVYTDNLEESQSKIDGFTIYGYTGTAAETYAADNDIEFVAIGGICGDNLTWTLEDGTLTISGTGDMYDYEYDSYAPWYDSRADITAVVVKDGVTTIGDYAFYNLRNATNVSIPGGVTSIGEWSFWNWLSLTSITLPDSLTSIGTDAFSDCSKLTSITIPSSVTSIGNRAFAYCNGLTDITISDGVTAIGMGAFSMCTSLIKVTIPGSVTSIGEWVFEGCEDLTIYGYTGSAAETYATDNDIEFVAIGGICGDNLTWTLDSDGTLIISGTGDMYDFEYKDTADGYTTPWSDCWKITQIKTVVIEDGVTSIGTYAAVGWMNITSLTIPDSVTSIHEYALSDCESLTSISIPDSVTSIGAYAFDWCVSLTSIEIPDSVTTIAEGTFMDCISLKEVTIPDSVTSIEGYAFYLCNELTRVTIPASVTKIGTRAFGYARGITPGFGAKLDDFTVYGYAGTAAEKYADENGFTFIALEDEKLPEFTDVAESAWYYTPVQWAVANGVTSGTSETTFSPGNKCTRAQAVTFLWNAKGQPEPKSTKNPFTDVKSTAWYYKAVLWAVENNITSGTSETTFSPNNTCTRGQIVTFFHNYAGKPAASGKNPFTDVPEKQWYYQPILWAVSEGVTAGLTPTAFGPTNTCTRGQIVTFLYNYLGKE